MSHRVVGFTLIAAGLAQFVLEHLNHTGPDSADFSFCYTPRTDCVEVGLVLGERYSIDTHAPLYMGQLVAVLDDRDTIVLTSYRDELLLLSTVLGLVVSA